MVTDGMMPEGVNLVAHIQGETGVLSLFEGVCDDDAGFLLTSVEGRLDEIHAEPFMRVGDDLLSRHGAIRIAHDWFAMNSYATSVRRNWTEWAGARLKGLPDVHFLVSSKLIAMGIATAGLGVSLLGGPRLISHWSRDDFHTEAFARLSC